MSSQMVKLSIDRSVSHPVYVKTGIYKISYLFFIMSNSFSVRRCFMLFLSSLYWYYIFLQFFFSCDFLTPSVRTLNQNHGWVNRHTELVFTTDWSSKHWISRSNPTWKPLGFHCTHTYVHAYDIHTQVQEANGGLNKLGISLCSTY